MSAKTRKKPDESPPARQADRAAEAPAPEGGREAPDPAAQAPQALTVRPAPHREFTREQLDLIKRTVCPPGTTDDEFRLFVMQCNRTGLDPFARQIYAIRRDGKLRAETGIDGYRLIADRTGRYAGNDDPVFDDEEAPRKATVTVYKIVGGVRCPFSASARWSQYCPPARQDFMWQKMPHLMLGKVAESLALRKAFPAELSGVYTSEEMGGREETEIVTDATDAVEKLKPGDVVTIDGQKCQVQRQPRPDEPPPPGPAFLAGLQSYDGKLAAQALCKPGELIKAVAAMGKRDRFPADMTAWSQAQIERAREVTRDFVARMQLQQDVDRLMAETGSQIADVMAVVCRRFSLPGTVGLASLTAEQLRFAVARLEEMPKRRASA